MTIADVFNLEYKEESIVYNVPKVVEEVNFEMRLYNDYYKARIKKATKKKPGSLKK